MIYLFNVYLLVTVVVFGAASIMLLSVLTATIAFKALMGAYNLAASLYRTPSESFSDLKHLKNKKVVHGDAT